MNITHLLIGHMYLQNTIVHELIEKRRKIVYIPREKLQKQTNTKHINILKLSYWINIDENIDNLDAKML